ncbi:MAG: complex I subunit 1 family protein [Candidatus Omnitrophota bacterium]
MNIFHFLIFPGFVFAGLVGLAATWVDRKVTARLQWRVGPPFLQPFYDIGKLLTKEVTIPNSADRMTFVLAPMVGLAAAGLVAAIMGMSISGNLNFAGDLIVVIYLLTIPSLMMMLGGFASGNILAQVGSSREMKLILAYELPFLLAIAAVIFKNGFSLRLNELLAFQRLSGLTIGSISGFLSFLAIILSVQAKLGLPPFDISEAETELMAGPLIEYSGLLLSFFRFTKTLLFYSLPLLIVILFFGGISFSGWHILTGILKYVGVLALLIVIKNTNPRVRVDQALNFFWKRVAPLALAGLIFALAGL